MRIQIPLLAVPPNSPGDEILKNILTEFDWGVYNETPGLLPHFLFSPLSSLVLSWGPIIMSINIERPTTNASLHSLASTVSHITENYGVSAPHLPDKIEAASERVVDNDDDWEKDPRNPRNWSSKRKWVATGIVNISNFCFFFFYN